MEGRETLTIVLSKGAIMAPMLVMSSTILRYSLSFSKRFAPRAWREISLHRFHGYRCIADAFDLDDRDLANQIARDSIGKWALPEKNKGVDTIGLRRTRSINIGSGLRLDTRTYSAIP